MWENLEFTEDLIMIKIVPEKCPKIFFYNVRNFLEYTSNYILWLDTKNTPLICSQHCRFCNRTGQGFIFSKEKVTTLMLHVYTSYFWLNCFNSMKYHLPHILTYLWISLVSDIWLFGHLVGCFMTFLDIFFMIPT